MIAPVVVNRNIAADLRWYFCESEGEMSAPSNFSAMIKILQNGGPSGGTPSTDLSESAIDAAVRARRIRRALQQLPNDQCLILRAAFSECAPIRPFGDLTGIVPLTVAAQCAWAISNSDKSLTEWLCRLAYRYVNGIGDTLRRDRCLIRHIQREAGHMQGNALRRYERASKQSKRELVN